MRTFIVVLTVCAALLLPSCCVFKGTCTDKPGQIATAVLDCTKAGIEADLPKVLPIIIDILKSGSGNLDAIVAALGGIAGIVSDGIEVVTCAIDAAVAISNAPPASQPSVALKMLGGKPAYTLQERENMKTVAAAWMIQKKVSVGQHSKLVSP